MVVGGRRLRAQPPVLDEDYWDRASVLGGSGTPGACAGEAASSWAPFRAGTAVTLGQALPCYSGA